MIEDALCCKNKQVHSSVLGSICLLYQLHIL